MPADDPLPGAEIEEVPSGVHPLQGVSTSAALFLGRTEKGPLQKPVLCESFPAFEHEFSSACAGSDLVRAVRLFFNNGGSRCFVLRLADKPVAANRAPLLPDYLEAFDLIDREVDLFNLLILPRDEDHAAPTRASLWGPASEYCRKRRALLLVDPPQGGSDEWNSVEDVLDPVRGVAGLSAGLVKDHCALYYPLVKIEENGVELTLGPSGALAGLMARVDSSRGVWKAPAGVEADLRGIAGLALILSDTDNTRLNTSGVNALRSLPGGIVSWGARTLAGNDQNDGEYKYLAVKRTALFLEESLRRGLQWTVFEPNDEPLWSRVRLNAGSFMQNLFRQGAFQGEKPEHAYLVKCDAQTTSSVDRTQGRVNLWVGFAPLKPAEFVILRLQLASGSPA
jgi:uncharacterized protein